MTRREALGLALAAGLVLLGRLLRRTLLVDDDGQWRQPGWLESHLPPLPEPVPVLPPRPARPSSPLDPNTCSPDSLQLLPGIGPALADRIAAARARGVHFACARDLQAIRGIGPRLSARLGPYLVFPQPDSSATGEMQPAR